MSICRRRGNNKREDHQKICTNTEWSQEERIGNPHKTVGEIPSWPSHWRKYGERNSPSRPKEIPDRQATFDVLRDGYNILRNTTI